MKKKIIPPRPFLSPLPALLVSCTYQGQHNIITLAWGGIVSSEPPRLTLGIQPIRHSYNLIKQAKEFVVNLPNTNLLEAAHFCGTKSGRDYDKFKELGLTPVLGEATASVLIEEAPISLECKLEDLIELEGTHHLFLGEILNVHLREELYSKQKSIDLQQADIISYGGGKYFSLGKEQQVKGSF